MSGKLCPEKRSNSRVEQETVSASDTCRVSVRPAGEPLQETAVR